MRSKHWKSAPKKSNNFTNCSVIKKHLEQVKWTHLGEQIPVEESFRYLGAQISVAARHATAVIDDRFKRAALMARKLARIPLSLKTKVAAIRGKIMPLAMYGVESASPQEKSILPVLQQQLLHVS